MKVEPVCLSEFCLPLEDLYVPVVYTVTPLAKKLILRSVESGTLG